MSSSMGVLGSNWKLAGFRTAAWNEPLRQYISGDCVTRTQSLKYVQKHAKHLMKFYS